MAGQLINLQTVEANFEAYIRKLASKKIGGEPLKPKENFEKIIYRLEYMFGFSINVILKQMDDTRNVKEKFDNAVAGQDYLKMRMNYAYPDHEAESRDVSKQFHDMKNYVSQSLSKDLSLNDQV